MEKANKYRKNKEISSTFVNQLKKKNTHNDDMMITQEELSGQEQRWTIIQNDPCSPASKARTQIHRNRMICRGVLIEAFFFPLLLLSLLNAVLSLLFRDWIDDKADAKVTVIPGGENGWGGKRPPSSRLGAELLLLLWERRGIKGAELSDPWSL